MLASKHKSGTRAYVKEPHQNPAPTHTPRTMTPPPSLSVACLPSISLLQLRLTRLLSRRLLALLQPALTTPFHSSSPFLSPTLTWHAVPAPVTQDKDQERGRDFAGGPGARDLGTRMTSTANTPGVLSRQPGSGRVSNLRHMGVVWKRGQINTAFRRRFFVLGLFFRFLVGRAITSPDQHATRQDSGTWKFSERACQTKPRDEGGYVEQDI